MLAMMEHLPFTPPHPPRHQGRLPVQELLARANRGLIEAFAESAFTTEVIELKLLARKLFIFNMPDAIQSIFITQSECFERKSPQMRHALEALLGDGLFISDGLVWKERRRVVQPITHPSRLADLTPTMTEVASEWCAAWQARPDGTRIDALEEMARFTAEVICRTIFGRALGRDTASEIVRCFSAYQAKVGNTDLISLLGLPDFLPRFQSFRVGAEVRRIHAAVDPMIASILDGRTGESSLIASMAEGAKMSRTAFRNEAITLFMAGHETTANTLAWAWYLISEAPWAEAALHAEWASVLGGREAGFDDLEKLPMTRAVVEETLRLYPPVPILARIAARDTVVTGVRVPKGSMVAASPWVVHRHQRHWETPNEFRPERFLPGAPPPAKYTYLPFSLGPRVCTGQHFGLYEAMICLATLGQRFRLRGVPGHRVAPVSRLTLRPGDRLPMTLERR